MSKTKDYFEGLEFNPNDLYLDADYDYVPNDLFLDEEQYLNDEQIAYGEFMTDYLRDCGRV